AIHRNGDDHSAGLGFTTAGGFHGLSRKAPTECTEVSVCEVDRDDLSTSARPFPGFVLRTSFFSFIPVLWITG
ncbi:hypothetical protein AB2E71_00890, partial (plasmid) [Escherichia coli]